MTEETCKDAKSKLRKAKAQQAVGAALIAGGGIATILGQPAVGFVAVTAGVGTAADAKDRKNAARQLAAKLGCAP